MTEKFGPWNPGVQSQLPRELLPLSTLFRPENMRTGLAAARELCDLTGLHIFELVAFRPERLALHELLIRVTADLSVPSGMRVEDLGINFREMVNRLLANHVASRMPEVIATYAALRAQLASIIESELATKIYLPASEPSESVSTRGGGWLRRILGFTHRAPRRVARPAHSAGPEGAIVAWWNAALAMPAEDRIHGAAFRALAKVVGSIVGRHGSMWGTRELIASIATDLACNDCASEEIGRLIDPWFVEAARREGFRLLPAQERPVIMKNR